MSVFKDPSTIFHPLPRAAIRSMHKGGGEAVDVGDQALMRGLGTALPRMRPRRSLSYFGRRHGAGHNPSDGSSSAVASPPRLRKWERAISARLHLPPHCPDKAHELACDCGTRHRQLVTATRQRSISGQRRAWAFKVMSRTVGETRS